MFCAKCGNKIKEGTRFCTRCGTPIDDGTVSEPKKVKKPDKEVKEVTPESIKGKLLALPISKKLALGAVGFAIVGGIITGVAVHNGKTEDTTAYVSSADTGELKSTEAAPEAIDMSAYQTQLDQWKELFAGYTLNTEMQESYNQSIADYQNAIAALDEATCMQCNSTLESLLSQAKQEVFRLAKIRNYYAGILTEVKYTNWEDTGDSEYSNKYAIVDIDTDGKEELIVSYTASDMAGMYEKVYEYDPDTDTLNLELETFPSNTYYDNGVVSSRWSHGGILAYRDDLFPYTVYKYDAASDTYLEESSMEAWEKEFNTEEFPKKVDKDKDGVVFSLGGGEYCDNAEYEAWRQTYFGDEQEINIPWQKIDDCEYEAYTDEYLRLFIQNVKDSRKIAGTDMGICFMEQNADYKAVGSLLSSKLELVESEYDEIYQEGLYNGKTVYSSCIEDAGSIAYYDEAVDDVTLLGLYPGMPEGEADALLKEYGFYSSEYCYYTGDGLRNYAVYLTIENGIVKRIMLSPYTKYCG